MLERASSNRNRKVRIIKKRYGGHTKERDSYSGSPSNSEHEVKNKKNVHLLVF
jgi:ankyrin repeat protein